MSAKASLEMIDAELLPLRRLLERHRELGVLVANEVLPGVAAVHAHESVEQELQIAAWRIPVDWTDDHPRIGKIESRIEVEIPGSYTPPTGPEVRPKRQELRDRRDRWHP